jgi:choline dehydrogenase-like flavoprotein
MVSANHYDVIIIGTCAGGGTLAYRLAPSGKRILLVAHPRARRCGLRQASSPQQQTLHLQLRLCREGSPWAAIMR